jgi:hypothetical protein
MGVVVIFFLAGRVDEYTYILLLRVDVLVLQLPVLKAIQYTAVGL